MDIVDRMHAIKCAFFETYPANEMSVCTVAHGAADENLLRSSTLSHASLQRRAHAHVLGVPMNSPKPVRRSFVAWLWRRPQRWYLLGVPVGGLLAFIVGIGFTGGFFGSLQYASTQEFCLSCHEMRQALQEMSHTEHYVNAVGVRAGCADCHVPPTFAAGLVRHVEAYKCVWGHLRGTLSTPVKYEARRLDMAQTVWKELDGNDSAECRSCHSPAAMVLAQQPAAAASAHQSLGSGGVTCIDCHKGIAHKLPVGS